MAKGAKFYCSPRSIAINPGFFSSNWAPDAERSIFLFFNALSVEITNHCLAATSLAGVFEGQSRVGIGFFRQNRHIGIMLDRIRRNQRQVTHELCGDRGI